MEIVRFQEPCQAPVASQIPLALLPPFPPKPGTSSLGNILLKGIHHFTKKLIPLFPGAVEILPHHFEWRNKSGKGICHLIHTGEFFSNLRAHYRPLLNLEERREFVGDLKEIRENFDQVVLAAGSFHHFVFPELGPPTKIVPGHYLVAPFPGGKDKSFVLTRGDSRLIYSGTRGLVLLTQKSPGSPKVNPPLAMEKKILENLHDFFSHHVLLPPFSSFTPGMGLRLKAPGRRPFAGQWAPGIFALGGFYKNGYAYAFPLASRLAREVLETNGRRVGPGRGKRPSILP